jgi:diguanylate cyclase (GGDEF)-like protein/PAS domain S-box-containing protein
VSTHVQTNDRYEALVECAPDPLMVISDREAIVVVNAELERVFGYSRAELLGQHYSLILPGAVSADSNTVQDHPLDRNITVVGRRRDGAELMVEVRRSKLSSLPGGEIAVFVRDVSHRQRRGTDAEAKLRSALSLLSSVLDSTGDGILVVSDQGRIEGANEQFIELWGIPAALMESGDDDRVMSFGLDQLVDPSGFVTKVRELYGDSNAESFDVVAFRDGRTIERYSRPQRTTAGVVGRVWNFRDVTSRQRAEDQARGLLAELVEQAEQHRLLAFKDPLTGLLNRALFNEHLDSALARRKDSEVHLLLVDLDDFKEVNNVFGHQAGDDLLVHVGRRLQGCVNPGDIVARLSGDEFVILLSRGNDPVSTARRVVAAFNTPAYLDGVEIPISVSLGFASSADGSLHGPELLRRADIALHEAKAAGKNRHESYHPDMMAALLLRTDLESGLRHAVQRHEILVHVQPIMSPEDANVSQLEVLVRWQRPTGIIAPLDFIPLAERNGAIVEIGEEVLRQACLQFGGWLDAGDVRSIAVNVSAVQVQDEHFATRILAILAAGGVRPVQVVVEVTESVFLAPGNRVIEQLSMLRHHGVRIAIDDFGTGYSSLGRLQDLPVDAIKVDKSFVDKIVTGDENLPILNSMIDMAHNLGLHVTAEGVETDAQAAQLVRLGCDALQGYLFARPHPVCDLPEAEARSTALIREVLDHAA